MAELTVASYNIHWGHRPKRLGGGPFDVVDACRRLDPDVLVLQESWAPDDGLADHQRVADALGLHVAVDLCLARSTLGPLPRVLARASQDTTFGNGGWHIAILSRLPTRPPAIHRLPRLWADHADRAVLATEIEVEGSTLDVRGTHLPHLKYGAHLSTMGLRRSLPSANVPGALIGDMNMWGWAINRMVPDGWRRAVRGKTWPSHHPRHQIDHLLITSSVEVLWGEVGPDLGSDHLPIRARLRW
ncbi:MAG: endonuclease/exonuclease/phosphatase family protein [Acidimicrobiales bacterium]